MRPMLVVLALAPALLAWSCDTDEDPLSTDDDEHDGRPRSGELPKGEANADGHGHGHLHGRDRYPSRSVTRGPVVLKDFTLESPEDIGNGVPLGGFSGLTQVRGEPANVFYTVMDRGPNGLIQTPTGSRRTFPLQDYVSNILQIKLNADRLEVLETIPIRRPDGTPISTRPNLNGADETPWDQTGTVQLSFDPEGLDPEGITYNPMDDTFWLSDEYESVVHVARDGRILARLVPQGRTYALGLGYARDSFPSYYTARPRNRGLEGISITPDGRFLFVVQQAPLNNPNATVGAASRVIRILKIDATTRDAVAEYLYIAEDAAQLVGVLQADVSLSDVYAVSEATLVVVERDKNAAALAQLKHIYRVDLTGATNVLNMSIVGGTSLEARSASQLATIGIVPVVKTLLVDILAVLPEFEHEKIEGLYLWNPRTLYFCIDNDFGVEYDGATQNLTGQPTQCYEMKFNQPLY